MIHQYRWVVGFHSIVKAVYLARRAAHLVRLKQLVDGFHRVQELLLQERGLRRSKMFSGSPPTRAKKTKNRKKITRTMNDTHEKTQLYEGAQNPHDETRH